MERETASPEKEIVVIGDIEMGAGNLTDDFISDQLLSGLIMELAERPHPVDLVLNGDTFDFLKCPSKLKPVTHYPRHITEEVSLAKLRLIHRAHLPVFEALARFVSGGEVSGGELAGGLASRPASRKGEVPVGRESRQSGESEREPKWNQKVEPKGKKNIYFILGNHDPDLVYEEVQEEIRSLLGNPPLERVRFPGLRYEGQGVYVEHGHQYDFVFKMNFEKLFLKHRDNSILNLPFVSFGLISHFMRLKEENPFIERIFPRPELLTHHRVIARKINSGTLGYFFKSLLYYPFRFYSDPTYTFPTGLVREFYHRLRTVHWDVDNITNIMLKNREVKKEVIVLGHIHEKRIAKGPKRVVIHPGSWRDEYNFNSRTRELIPRSKRYVRISIINGRPIYELVDMSRRRSILYLDEVLKNELSFIRAAAAEENYPLANPGNL